MEGSPAGHRIRAPCMPARRTRRSPVCAATDQNGFCGVDHGVRAIAPRPRHLPGSRDAQFARPLNLLRHSGRLTMCRAGPPKAAWRRRCSAGAFPDSQEVGDGGQHHHRAKYHHDRGGLCAIGRRRDVLSWTASVPHSIASTPPSVASAAHRQTPGMTQEIERPRKLGVPRSRKKAGARCDRSNAVINAAKTILARCGADWASAVSFWPACMALGSDGQRAILPNGAPPMGARDGPAQYEGSLIK